ncbi:FAD-binding oxidoreductase [Providencia alcalifaciens]|uniref:FAD-binding oxidoreductase n=1 Tax=Providencia alcalifaciens TaxID=126385 RepID=UPI0004459986|nr:FAD-binding oxidoreductase [Providencia alcalifaciens]ETT07715.1 putative CDP-6-deoxy-L-threo-D-glycero-4-hexulose-3-dehydrase reductase [Providencia alcalifaciens F90-2004]EUC95040.1 putative CDP-6-deoxy-L-threo-D-glycero-4-hexulose-3-dehydrase reductase [Providencia alcalifaciens PAL-2]MTB33179.1 2Fe-2S iron-sulfur cluster binding domain-containing protein [Providencia alcalifaciens]MTC97584.1 2Fe-2S iron-sulfur cluster binding domain-containing protein [Providencia alcalifaciens]
MPYKITIEPAGVTYTSENNLLDDALNQAVPIEYSCKTGDCRTCQAEIISGSAKNEHNEIVCNGSILTCQSKAQSNLTLKVNYYPELKDIKVQTLPCKISSIKYITDDIIILKLRLPPTNNFTYLPGQYIDLIYKNIKRSYSIANINSKELELHIRYVPSGIMSDYIFKQFSENQLMRIEGPKGTFFVRHNSKSLILIATGTGIAPIKAILEQLLAINDPRHVYIYWGMQYKNELYCTEIEQYAKKFPHIHFNPVLSKESDWKGHQGYVQNAVIKDFDSLATMEVYACGSLNMIQEAQDLFFQYGLPSDAFHSDAFTPAK